MHPEWWPDGYQKYIDAENNACYDPNKAGASMFCFACALPVLCPQDLPAKCLPCRALDTGGVPCCGNLVNDSSFDTGFKGAMRS